MKIKDMNKQCNTNLFIRSCQCCGCGACMSVCRMHAIKMEERELGCLYPIIDERVCIKCGKCEQVCSYKGDMPEMRLPYAVYAAVSKQKEFLENSASGAVFATLGNMFLKNGGVVFGCSMEIEKELLTPKHIKVDNVSDLSKLQGSKYVQSSLGNTFEQIKKMLLNKRNVLFSGTPCQVGALKKYLKNIDISKLYTIDIICHGVPSKKFFQDYIDILSKQVHGSIKEFLFRDKTLGWGLNSKVSYVSKDGYVSKLLPPELSSYYSYFLGSESYRESCYSCQYATLQRVGDITIGDFWCLEKEHPEYLVNNGGTYEMKKGVSCLLINTEQGAVLVNNFGEDLELKQSDAARVMRWNHQLCSPSKHSEKREQLIEAYSGGGYAGVEKMFRKEIGIKYHVRKLRNYIKLRK